MILNVVLCLYRCSYRAVCSACSAVDAGALVDDERRALGNSLYRAVGCAQSACDALISDLECHSVTSFVTNDIYG